jgi:hypothetical protein
MSYLAMKLVSLTDCSVEVQLQAARMHYLVARIVTVADYLMPNWKRFLWSYSVQLQLRRLLLQPIYVKEKIKNLNIVQFLLLENNTIIYILFYIIKQNLVKNELIRCFRCVEK